MDAALNIRRYWAVGIVIPARDEEALIGACIDSVMCAAKTAGSRFWAVVVADSCTDNTARVARAHLGAQGEVVQCAKGSAGAARRLGVEAVLTHFARVAPRSIWLANTDADTRVPANWLTTQLHLADTGITGIAGIIKLEDSGSPEALEAYRANYRVTSDGSHGHVHGANLAFRADAYLDVGGWCAAQLAEDHCLWRRLKAGGWRLRSDALNQVCTSARLIGRAAGGFADTLKATIDGRCRAAS